MNAVPSSIVLADVERALAEDIGTGDVTADLLPALMPARARVITREAAVLCGQAWFEACFRQLDADMQFEWAAEEAHASPGQLLCQMQGRARALVTAERSALTSADAVGDRDHHRRPCRRRAAREAHPRHAQDPARPASGTEVRGQIRGGVNHRVAFSMPCDS